MDRLLEYKDRLKRAAGALAASRTDDAVWRSTRDRQTSNTRLRRRCQTQGLLPLCELILGIKLCQDKGPQECGRRIPFSQFDSASDVRVDPSPPHR